MTFPKEGRKQTEPLLSVAGPLPAYKQGGSKFFEGDSVMGGRRFLNHTVNSNCRRIRRKVCIFWNVCLRFSKFWKRQNWNDSFAEYRVAPLMHDLIWLLGWSAECSVVGPAAIVVSACAAPPSPCLWLCLVGYSPHQLCDSFLCFCLFFSWMRGWLSALDIFVPFFKWYVLSYYFKF